MAMAAAAEWRARAETEVEAVGTLEGVPAEDEGTEGTMEMEGLAGDAMEVLEEVSEEGLEARQVEVGGRGDERAKGCEVEAEVGAEREWAEVEEERTDGVAEAQVVAEMVVAGRVAAAEAGGVEEAAEAELVMAAGRLEGRREVPMGAEGEAQGAATPEAAAGLATAEEIRVAGSPVAAREVESKAAERSEERTEGGQEEEAMVKEALVEAALATGADGAEAV
ncbi:hypothetical protein AB1Y20_021578 [Prymnesium parvum]|uniref:Uncharacterized protein n=1 Tax=Prymnesium parvum TaxID=97485 RepID=A0AB34JK17_PRYPA